MVIMGLYLAFMLIKHGDCGAVSEFARCTRSPCVVGLLNSPFVTVENMSDNTKTIQDE